MRSIQHVCLLAGLCAALPTPAAAQVFNNPGFESGGLHFWTAFNTSNGVGAPGIVLPLDIDGPGPLGVSWAARFAAGQAQVQAGIQQGVFLTQSLSLIAGTTYTVDFDWSVQKFSGSIAGEAGVFALIHGTSVIAPISSGPVGVTTPRYGRYTGSFTATATGPVNVGVRVSRPFLPATDLYQYVDNFAIRVAAPAGPPLGTLPMGTTTVIGTLAVDEVRWYSLTIPEVVPFTYLDIDTEGSTLAPFNDTEIALYTAAGTLVATDDNDGSGNLSQLTFGSTITRPAVGNGLIYNGRDGTLAAGAYYLAVSGFDTVFGAANFGAISGSTNIGNYQVRLVLGNNAPTGACCDPAGTCSISTHAACTSAGGVYFGNGSDCANINCSQTCPPITGRLITGTPGWPVLHTLIPGPRLLRDGAPDTCAVPGAAAPSGMGPYDTDVYDYMNTSANPVCVSFGLIATGDCNIYAGAYIGGFNPANVVLNNIASTGTSTGVAPLSPLGMSFIVPANTAFQIVVNDTNPVGFTMCASPYTFWLVSNGALSCNPPQPMCYPNCDLSTTPPILNVQDFACYLNAFAGGDPYANCDLSTTAPTLNVQDFACFLNRFAAGCS